MFQLFHGTLNHEILTLGCFKKKYNKKVRYKCRSGSWNRELNSS